MHPALILLGVFLVIALLARKAKAIGSAKRIPDALIAAGLAIAVTV